MFCIQQNATATRKLFYHRYCRVLLSIATYNSVDIKYSYIHTVLFERNDFTRYALFAYIHIRSYILKTCVDM